MMILCDCNNCALVFLARSGWKRLIKNAGVVLHIERDHTKQQHQLFRASLDDISRLQLQLQLQF